LLVNTKHIKKGSNENKPEFLPDYIYPFKCCIQLHGHQTQALQAQGQGSQNAEIVQTDKFKVYSGCLDVS